MKVLAEWEARKRAVESLQSIAGEIGATYDALIEVYTYRKAEGIRQLKLVEKERSGDKPIFQVVLIADGE